MVEPADGKQEPGIVRSLRPFHDSWQAYYEVGWFPIPLQPKSKANLEKGVTGSKNPFPASDAEKMEKLSRWTDLEAGTAVPAQCNIGLWFDESVIGIDIDHYGDKVGATELKALEKRLGRLPKTWISTARADGHSGIRFFRIPARWVGNLHWDSKADECIDIVQSGHRYAAVWPSWNPASDSEYLWYAPGNALNGKPDLPFKVVDGPLSAGGYRTNAMFVLQQLPAVADLPYLPDAWIDHITKGKQERQKVASDEQSSGDEIVQWALDHFIKAKAEPCKTVRRCLINAKKRIEQDPSSHDKITAGHWNVLSCGLEGHQGVISAMLRLEKFWTLDVVRDQEKRSNNEAANEIYRSRMGALRKLKGKEETANKLGVSLVETVCSCEPTIARAAEARSGVETPEVGGNAKSDPQGGSVNVGGAQEPEDYRLNDDGNADHLMDLFGKDLMYVPGYGKWMKWNGKRWELDEDGLARRCFRVVRDRQEALAQACLAKQYEVLESCGGSLDHPEFKAAKALAKMWHDFARRSGSNAGANGALEAAQHNEGASVSADVLDANERLLGVENGVLELNADAPATFRQAQREDYVAYNTGVKYLEPADLARAGGNIARGRELWKQYLDRFVPDLDLRLFIQKALGYCLLGSNEQRLAIFLYGGTSTGKSTMLNAVVSALGQYAETVDLAIFKEKASGLNPALAQAMPRRIITSSEAGMQNHLHADLFKRMTGNDRMSAELKGVNVIVTRIPAFTPLIATNSPPTIKGADAALHKRLLVIPFKETVDEEHDEKSASVDLARYGSEAVLSWLVDGWALYAKEGLDRRFWPAIVRGETEFFSSHLNDLGQFVAERVIKRAPAKKTAGVKGRVAEWGIGKNAERVKDVYDMYQRWCASNNVHAMDILKPYPFGLRMIDLGFSSKNVWDPEVGKTVRCYLGLSLADFEIDGKVAKLNVKSRTD